MHSSFACNTNVLLSFGNCEILCNHLTNFNKYREQRDRPDLSQLESLQLYLKTRFEQLKIATELELWQVIPCLGCDVTSALYVDQTVDGHKSIKHLLGSV